MVRRHHRSIYDELDELRASMDYLYQLALDPADNPLLPEEEPKIVCRSVHNLNAEVAEQHDAVMVTIDTIRGSGNSTISMELTDENTLVITCTREEEKKGDSDRSGRHERRSFSLHHVIPLPCPVMAAGAGMSLRNSVLDIHLKKKQHA